MGEPPPHCCQAGVAHDAQHSSLAGEDAPLRLSKGISTSVPARLHSVSCPESHFSPPSIHSLTCTHSVHSHT